MVKDERYWYGKGWPRLVKRACAVACHCQPRPDADPDQAWLVDVLWPALLRLPDGAGDAISCLLGEPRRLLEKLQRQQPVSNRHLARCLCDYLWEQKLKFQGDASPDRLSVWQAIRDRMQTHFPPDTDWFRERHQRELLALLTADSRRDLPRKLTTLQDYLWRFHLGEFLDVDADDVRQMLRHSGTFSETLMARLAHCLDELRRESQELFAAVQRELDRDDPPPLDCSPATQHRRKQAGSLALAECMEPVTTFQESPR